MGAATSSDIEHQSPIVVLALGSWEQHGPHLPLDTDTVIIDTVVQSALMLLNDSRAQFLVAPTLSITASDEHAGFAGTLSTGSAALKDSVVAICRSASWARGVCIVNGHGGNLDALSAIVSALDYEGIAHSVWSLPGYTGSDMHAGKTETSLMMHIAPHAVRHDRIVDGNTDDWQTLMPAMRDGGVAAVSPTGVLGSAREATADHGARVLDFYARHLAQHFTDAISRWKTDES
jgi:mycofactocin system creatininase family protein